MSDLLTYFQDLDPYDFLIDTVYPAPAAVDPIADYTAMPIKDIKASLTFDELWRISNSFIKRKNYSEALKYVQIAIKKEPHKMRLKALRGVCFLFLGDSTKAISDFNSVLKKDPTLHETRLWLSFVKARQEKWSASAKHLADISVMSTTPLFILKLLIELWISEALHKKTKYKSLIKELHHYHDNMFCSDILTLHYFREGREKLEKGDLISAARTWLVTFERDQLAWYRHRVIASTIQTYASDRVFFLQARKGESFYGKVLEKLLHLSLLPEFFEEAKSLKARARYWKSKLSVKGGYPYAHFRYALCLAYDDKTRQAYDELLACRDKIPPSKVSFFRIDELIDWLRDPEFDEEKTDPWQFFFESEYEIEAWQKHGFSDPRTARRWKTLGATPEEARNWCDIFESDPSLAYGYFASGFRDPLVAYTWSKNFSVPSVAWECYTREINVRSEE